MELLIGLIKNASYKHTQFTLGEYNKKKINLIS